MSQDGVQGNGDGGYNGVSISADGRYVAYISFASNLVPGDTNKMASIRSLRRHEPNDIAWYIG